MSWCQVEEGENWRRSQWASKQIKNTWGNFYFHSSNQIVSNNTSPKAQILLNVNNEQLLESKVGCIIE